MLRESEKGTCMLRKLLERTLQANARTMLRYAIERFPAAKRALFMKGGI